MKEASLMRILHTPSSRWLAGIALVVLVVVILSVVLALVNRQGVSLLPEDMPEGVVQRYLLALQEGDSKRAYGYLNGELQEHCTYQYFWDSTRTLEMGDMRITLEGTEPLDGEVGVRVRVTELDLSLPFDRGEFSYSILYTLGREKDAWRFSEPPWPLGWCLGLERKSVPSAPPPAGVD